MSDWSEERWQKLDNLFGLDGAFENLKVEVPDGDSGDDRQGFPKGGA